MIQLQNRRFDLILVSSIIHKNVSCIYDLNVDSLLVWVSQQMSDTETAREVVVPKGATESLSLCHEVCDESALL